MARRDRRLNARDIAWIRRYYARRVRFAYVSVGIDIILGTGTVVLGLWVAIAADQIPLLRSQGLGLVVVGIASFFAVVLDLLFRRIDSEIARSYPDGMEGVALAARHAWHIALAGLLPLVAVGVAVLSPVAIALIGGMLLGPRSNLRFIRRLVVLSEKVEEPCSDSAARA